MTSHDKRPFAVGQTVLLRSFNGTNIAPEGCAPEENYWMLIGQAAEVVAPKSEQQRVLLRFGISVRHLDFTVTTKWKTPSGFLSLTLRQHVDGRETTL
jgi:hypothetical protein